MDLFSQSKFFTLLKSNRSTTDQLLAYVCSGMTLPCMKNIQRIGARPVWPYFWVLLASEEWVDSMGQVDFLRMRRVVVMVVPRLIS